jgi:multicomponent Na+:H+ antiporter subunit E
MHPAEDAEAVTIAPVGMRCARITARPRIKEDDMQDEDLSQPVKAWGPVPPHKFRTTRMTAPSSRPVVRRDRAMDELAQESGAGPIDVVEPARGWRSLFGTVGGLALLWVGLAGPDPASWVVAGPVIAVATALTFAFPPARRLRFAPIGAIRFLAWFAVASLRGAVDVAGRALAWRMPLAPGLRSYETDLPPGASRLVFVNAITLLPGTLSAGISGTRIEVHMLDTRVDLAAELAPLEARVRGLFALPAPGAIPARTSPNTEIGK